MPASISEWRLEDVWSMLAFLLLVVSKHFTQLNMENHQFERIIIIAEGKVNEEDGEEGDLKENEMVHPRLLWTGDCASQSLAHGIITTMLALHCVFPGPPFCVLCFPLAGRGGRLRNLHSQHTTIVPYLMKA